jgi:hypothetical protein
LCLTFVGELSGLDGGRYRALGLPAVLPSAVGIWDLGFGIWDLGFGIWDLGLSPYSRCCLRRLEFGIWHLEFGIISLQSMLPSAVGIYF